MNKSISLFFICCFAAQLSAQAPFSITANSFPLFGIQAFQGPSTGTNLNAAANGTWDFSGIHSASTAALYHYPETDPFYTNAGVDVYVQDFKNLTSNLGYIIYSEFDFNATGVYDKGIYVDKQAYGIGALSGNAADSLRFPLQGSIATGGRKVMQFPATFQSSWSSQSRRVVDFTISVAALGLNNAPIQHVYTLFRTDSIAAWGTMRVYSNGIPSIPYEVLINKSSQYALDSFLLNGAPAPGALLTAFGMSQGQKTGINKRYTAYRPGNSTPLAIFNYGNNNYTTPTGIFFDTDNLTQSSKTSSAERQKFSTLLFPNPSASGEINLQIVGEVPALERYEVLDLQGRLLQSGGVEANSKNISIQMNAGTLNGQYWLRLIGDRNQTLISESFLLQQ